MGGRSKSKSGDDDTPASTTQDLFGGRNMNRTAMPASMPAATRPSTRSTTVADTVTTLADTVAAALAPSLVFLHAVFTCCFSSPIHQTHHEMIHPSSPQLTMPRCILLRR